MDTLPLLALMLAGDLSMISAGPDFKTAPFKWQTVPAWQWMPQYSTQACTIMVCSGIAMSKGLNALMYNATTGDCTVGKHQRNGFCMPPLPSVTLMSTEPIETDIGQCPYDAPYAIASGALCCSIFLRVNNTGSNPICNGKAIQLTDPAQCCAGATIQCPSVKTGCQTHKDTRFNATKLMVLSENIIDSTMDLSSYTFNSSLPGQWPNPGGADRGAPFGGAYGDCMMVCQGAGSNLCYRTHSRHPGNWTLAPTMLATHYLGGAVMVLDSKLWVVGGATNVTELFDFTTQTWSYGPQLISAVASYSTLIKPVALSRTKVFFIGGCSSGWGATAHAYTFDFATSTWTALTNLNTGRCDSAYGVVLMADGSQVAFAVAGNSAGSMEVYNFTSNAWTVLAQQLSAGYCSGMIGCVANNRVFLLGGKTGVYSNQTLEINATTMSVPTSGWAAPTTLPNPDQFIVCVPFH